MFTRIGEMENNLYVYEVKTGLNNNLLIRMRCGVHICIFLVFQFVYFLIIVFCVVVTTAALAYTHKRKVTGILSYLVIQKCISLKWF